MPGIIDYDRQLLERYRNPTLRDKVTALAWRAFFTVTYPLFAAIRAWHRYQLRNLR